MIKCNYERNGVYIGNIRALLRCSSSIGDSTVKRPLVIRNSSSYTQRSKRIPVCESLILMTFLLVGCGSSDDSNGSGCNVILAILTGGIGCIAEILGVPVSTGSGSSNPITTTPPPEPPTTPPPPVESAEFYPLISRVVYDVEPNDSMSTASAASLATGQVPEQRVGFSAYGAINNLTDGVDTYAFTAARSRTFVFALTHRDPTTDGILDVATAYFSVLDQYGTVLLSSQGDTRFGNGQHAMRIDAGVLYYVMVVAEDTVNEEQKYTLRVSESYDELKQDREPTAPILSAGEAMSLTVTLDWIAPPMNVDGTPLLDLAGYNVYFGSLSGIYTDFRVLDNPGLVTYVMDLPSSGSWFIAITALNSAGAESDFSNEVVVSTICECDLPSPGEMP